MLRRGFLVGVVFILAGGCSELGLRSDNGQSILFSEIGSQFFQDSVFLIHSNGSRLRTILAAQPGRSFPFAHGNSLRTQLVVLVHQLTPEQKVENRIHLYRPATGDLTRVAIGQEGFEGFASLAPGDDRIAFAFTPTSRVPSVEIWMHDLSSGESRKLTGADRAQDTFPCWRPDGREIIFLRLLLSGPALQTVLMAVPSDGGNARVLLGPEDGVAAACFAPDGNRIAIWSRRGLEVVRLSDFRREVILEGSLFPGHQFVGAGITWSATEDRIAFALFNTRTGQHELWTVASDGSGRRQIFTTKGGRIVVSSFVRE